MIVYAVAIFCASAIIFSRVAFSLAAAFVVSQGSIMLVASSGFLNYIAWTLVIMGIVYGLSTFPRVDMALKFLCTILLSVVLVFLVVTMFGGIIAAIAKKEFVFSTAYEILVKVICTLFAFGSMLVHKKPHYDSPDNLLMCNLERGLASLMYGFAVTFLFMSVGGNWNLSGFFAFLILIASTVAAFIADIRLAGKDILGLETHDEVVMPK